MWGKQRGSALISALFIMTLVAIAATAMSTRLQLDIYRTRISLKSDKLYLASQVVTFWAMEQLSAKDMSEKVGEFPRKLQHIYPGVFIEGHISDLQSKFNINNLPDKKYRLLFYNLVENLPKHPTTSQGKSIFDAASQWMIAYQPERGQDKFLNHYLKQKPPYYPGYQLMQNVSEFRLVYGVTAELYQALLPDLTALPEVTAININSASKAVLKGLGNGLNDAQVKELIEARGEKGITDLSKVSVLLKTLGISLEQITIESNYFLSVATASIDDSHLTLYTLLKREKNKKNGVTVSVVSESLNTD